jgi:hypothetical protein
VPIKNEGEKENEACTVANTFEFYTVILPFAFLILPLLLARLICGKIIVPIKNEREKGK